MYEDRRLFNTDIYRLVNWFFELYPVDIFKGLAHNVNQLKQTIIHQYYQQHIDLLADTNYNNSINLM